MRCYAIRLDSLSDCLIDFLQQQQVTTVSSSVLHQSSSDN